MYFLEQVAKQLSLTLCSYDAPSENAAGGTVEEEAVQPSEQQQQGPQTAEVLAFQELNEELDAIDNDSGLVNRYTNILGNFLVRVRRGEIEGLSEDDSDFQRLLSLYKNKFEELKDMRNRGHEIEHVINFEISRLNETVDRGTAGENIDSMLDTAYEEQVESREQQEELERLETQRESIAGNIRSSLEGIDRASEDFSKYSTRAQILIELAFELTDRERVFTNERIDRLTGETIEISNIEALYTDTIQLEEVYRNLAIILQNEAIPGTETSSEVAESGIERAFLDLKENGSEIVKEIIGEKSYIDMQKGDFMRLWLESDVDLGSLFLTELNPGVGESRIGESYRLNFGGNPAVTDLLASIIPISVEKITVDGRSAHRSGERDFVLEGGLPVPIQDGSEIIIQEDNTEISPEQVETRIDSYRESMASNVNREDFERRVNDQILQNDIMGEDHNDNWLTTIIKKIINAMAEAVGEDPVFEEVLEKEEETLYSYSDDDSGRIQNQGMRRFSPDGQEILRDTEFMQSLNAMCDRLGVQRDDMLIVMQAESKLDPNAINSRSGASGLIQFMPSTAVGLGTSVAAIRNMTAVEQLVYVEKYFENYAGRMNSVSDIYRVVFYPASIGKPADWVMGSQNGTAQSVASQNGPGITQHSRRSDGLIDNATFDRYVTAKIAQFSSFQAPAPSNISVEGLGSLSESRRKVVQKALDAENSGDILGAVHCTDWVDRIYQSETGKSVYDAPKIFDGGVSTVPSTGSGDTGLRVREYAGDDAISQVQAGDHIMVDHGPGYGRGRTHSVIALETPQNGILQVVSYPNGGRPPVIELYDLTGQGRSGARPEKAMRIHSLS